METVNDMERKVIADAMTMETYEAGQIIIRQGDPGTAFYIVASGSVACTMQASESSPPEELCRLSEGEYFVSRGSFVIIHASTHTHTFLFPFLLLLNAILWCR